MRYFCLVITLAACACSSGSKEDSAAHCNATQRAAFEAWDAYYPEVKALNDKLLADPASDRKLMKRLDHVGTHRLLVLDLREYSVGPRASSTKLWTLAKKLKRPTALASANFDKGMAASKQVYEACATVAP